VREWDLLKNFTSHVPTDFILIDFPKPTLTVEPQSSVITGDRVTLRCSLDQTLGGWEFLWSKDSNTESTDAANKVIDPVQISDGGQYKCRARREGRYTDYSEPVTVTIHGEYFLWEITNKNFIRHLIRDYNSYREQHFSLTWFNRCVWWSLWFCWVNPITITYLQYQREMIGE